MEKFIKKNIVSIVLFFIGAICGFLYWKFVGCANGACAIKSNPYLMTLYGAILGYLLGGTIDGFVAKRKVKE